MKKNPFILSPSSLKSPPDSDFLKPSTESTPRQSVDSSYAYFSTSFPQKDLKRLESLLIEKEKKIEEKEEEFRVSLESLTTEKEFIVKEKKNIEKKSREIEVRIRALQEKENELKQAAEKSNFDRKRLEEEKNNIMQLRSKVEANYAESEKIKEVNIFAQENLQKDVKKFEVECKIFEEKVQALKLKQDYIERSNEELDRRKKKLEEERLRMEQEKSELFKIKQQISDDRLILFEDKKELERSKKHSFDVSLVTNERSINGNSVDYLYDKLRAQIEVFNQEVSIRERKIRDQQQNISREQVRIAKSLFQLQNIHESLMRTKHEILVFNSDILPQIEIMFRESHELVGILKSKYDDVQSLYERLNNGISVYAGNNGERRRYENKGSLGPRKELEQYESEEQKMMTELKEAKKKADTAQKEIAEEKEKIKTQFKQLEKAAKKINQTKVEVLQYKAELDERAKLLNIKEKQLERMSIDFQ
jgi:chromosome segregation ATPase